MALFSDKYWLLKHIRNAYMTTDDTGICKAVMSSDNMPNQLKDRLSVYPGSSYDESDSDDFSSESYDLRSEADFGLRYHRTTNAPPIEDQDKKKIIKSKVVKCETMKESLTQEEIDDLFQERKVKAASPKKSLLSLNLKKSLNVPLNPYIEYSKFDGSSHVSIPTREYKIFLTMLPEEQRNYPMDICCIASARIKDLIGLILLKCSTVHGDVTLKPIDEYGLYITEEDGEVDTDFPCLNPNECVAKFGFVCLGLVDHGKQQTFENGDSISSSEPLQSEKDSDRQKKSLLHSRINEAKQLMTDLQLIDGHNRAMAAHLYKSYSVNMVYKMRSKVEIYLGISSDKLEIDPVQKKGLKLPFLKQKPISHQMNAVAWCEILDKRSSKTTFRVMYSPYFEAVENPPSESPRSSTLLESSVSFKHYDFETDHKTAEEIVQKINSILELRSSLSRKEYIILKERKSFKKKNKTS